MPKTVQEVLKESGLTDEQIAALDAKVISGVTTLVTSANQDLEKAELARRAQEEQFTGKIAPALDNWANEKANIEAQLNYYKTLADKAKEGGFLPTDAPFNPPAAAATRGADGKFVAGANPVPGSPGYVDEVKKIRTEIAGALGSLTDLQWKYQSLYGTPMPDAPTALIAEAQAQHMDPIAYAAKKYDFAGKEAAKKAEEQKKHDDAIRAEVAAAKDKEWSEKMGNNPDLRQGKTSEFSEIRKAVDDKKRPDPLMMTEAERVANTRRQIREEVAARQTVQ